MPISNIPDGFMPDGRTIADQVSDNEAKQREVRNRMQRFKDTMQPGGTWTVGDYGDALPPKSY
jgi:hypothetical protein